MQKFYVTTPIYYVNARPHLGSLYSTLLADVASRYNKLHNKNVFFLTGTDEHGQKIAQSAAAVGKKPQDFVDSFIPAFKDAWKLYNIDYTKFIRTTDSDHIQAVQAWIKRLIDKGDIYKSHYAGYYCVSCEAFVTDKDMPHGITENIPLCPTCGRTTEYVSEESYFFKLSSYQERLLQFYKDNPDFITPRERMAEVISFVQSGLKDLSISRTTIDWGIPFPGDKNHVTYVWADALNNYITGVGYGVPGKEKEFNVWWPADLQILGKDIVRFHAVFWPAFLMASGLPMPKKLLVHGWIKIGEHKMSKSRGNAVDPVELATTYGVDQVRYYLVRHLAITQDSPFTYADLEQRINSDLSHDLGNLLNRTITLALKYNVAMVECPKTWSAESVALYEAGKNITVRFMQEMEAGYMNRAYAVVWEYIHEVNKYFHNQQPWKIAQSESEKFAEVISATCHALYTIAHLSWPLMPQKMEQLLFALGKKINIEQDVFAHLLSVPWKETFSLTQGEILFNKIDIKLETQETVMTQQEVKQSPTIIIDDFTKIELRVGMIEDVQVLEKSDKLYILKVNFGDHGVRQILSGIRKHFTPEQILHRQGVFVYNLAPRKMMGLESQGMMLFAKDAQEQLVLIQPEHTIPNGTQLS
ncbi:MAG: methionine--tRNA ligase [Candidatus Babeliaceae bacterium]|nr:methionine--tRNA ligase [Candidatus Babeliaceae bacterium]